MPLSRIKTNSINNPVALTAPVINNVGYTTHLGFKNKIINGDMSIAQRGTSFSHNGATGRYPVDRFYSIMYDAGYTSPTGGTVAQVTLTDSIFDGGVQITEAIRITPHTSSKLCYLWQKIEDVRQFSNTTVTFSFYARVNSGTFTPSNGLRFEQAFGTGGSTEVNTFVNWPKAITTSWQRFEVTTSLPSISGKTLGAGNHLNVMFYSNENISSIGWLEITGVQLETGSVATTFERRPPQIELGLCQRYYIDCGTWFVQGYGYGTGTDGTGSALMFPTTMRATPTMSKPSGQDDGGSAATMVFNNTTSRGTSPEAVSTNGSYGQWVIAAVTADAEL
jgi:hypothetical protein